jgi:RNA polymerase sigma-70 factor, ECF subfamily
MKDESTFKAGEFGDDPERDLRLMQRIKRGDTDAFNDLVEIHQHRVIGTVARMLGDDNDAEDIAQRVFIRIWKSAACWEPTAKFTTWLYTIMRNLVFNECRRRARRPALSLNSLQDDEERPCEFADSHAKTPNAVLLDIEMQHSIECAIRELPEKQRMAVVLRRYEEVSYDEIGEILGITLAGVKSVLFRARTALRSKLRVYLGDELPE